MNKKSIYFSYSNQPENNDLIIEHTLKYSDIDEIKALLEKFGITKCKEVWERTLLSDGRLKKLNYFLAKFFFNISDDDLTIKDYFKHHTTTRAERLNELLN